MALKPNSMIGIVGGGQLGRMTAIAATNMGYKVHVYTPERASPTEDIAHKTTISPYEDTKALEEFAKSVNVITYEFENIPLSAVETLNKVTEVFPKPKVLEISQDRIKEKGFLNSIGVQTADYMPVTSKQDFIKADEQLERPFILKTAKMGYDGKGQWKIDSDASYKQVLDMLDKTKDHYFVAEAFVPFVKEISVIVARDKQGEALCYDAAENIHKDGILKESMLPANITKQMQRKAQDVALNIAKKLDLIGVLAVEIFVCTDATIKVNELAPRPHNSGHYTMDACKTSQFEQLIRAVAGHKLGSPKRHSSARMVNILGEEFYDIDKYFADENAKVHIYGKREVKEGRKMAHVTYVYALEQEQNPVTQQEFSYIKAS